MLFLPPPNKTVRKVRLFSYGAGVQSFAVLVLQAQGKLVQPFDYFVFSNVGEDSENPETLRHYREVALPLAAAHNIQFVEVQKTYKGQPDTVFQAVMRDNLSLPIPYFFNSGKQANRSCTSDFKIRVVAKWIKDNDYSHAVVGLGISTDEARRMKSEQWHATHGKEVLGFNRKYAHPLIDLLLSRNDCHSIIQQSGYPTPPKSACFFCPFKRRGEWIEMKKHEPELWQKALELEARLNEKYRLINDRTRKEEDVVATLHPDKKPLSVAVLDQMSMFDEYMDKDTECQSGYCGI